MKLKSYFAGTVEAAMALASKELGEDAMLVYSREATVETRYLGRYEVVFALPEAPGPQVPAKTATAPQTSLTPEPKPESNPALEHVFQEMSVLRSQLEKLSSQLQMPAAPAPPQAPSPALDTPADRNAKAAVSVAAAAAECLKTAEVAPDLIACIVEGIERRIASDVSLTPPAALRAELAARIHVDSRAGCMAQGSRIVILVGPPGAGKTTSIVKIAARYMNETHCPPALVSFDNYRIGGADQLRTFASLLGAPFQAVEAPASLLASLRSLSAHDLILVDTSGYSDKDMDAASDLERFLSICPAAEVHLTLSATTKPADLRRAVERFTRFRPTRLVFTRLDETSSFGPIWSESVRQGWPLSFFSEGQQIPEDLREADAEWLAGQIAGEWVQEPTPVIASQPAMPTQDPPERSTPWLADAFLPLQKPVWTGVSAG
ncbi:MAG: hypothetical protein JNN08_17365 [Bryobacterales bacterium]|nr:hypothetical protein [Bryobacterales bacterium]